MAVSINCIPVQNYSVSSKFGMRGSSFHYGLDMPGAKGSNIYAAQGGVVKYFGNDPDGYGNYIILEHQRYKFCTLYAHLSAFSTSVGSFVTAGDVIGKMGLKKTILPRLTKGLPDLTDEKIPDELLKRITNIRVIACGTAMHAGMVARALIEPRLRIPVTVSIASEFRYEEPLIDDSTLTIVISQSGETIDTLAALRLARECGSTVISVVNVKGSTIARESDYVIYTHGGPEIAVASTKAYTVQIAALYLLFCRMALIRGVYTEEHAEQFMSDLLNCATSMETMIREENTINEIVTHIVNYPDVFFIGRGMDYAFSLEGALKLKEISYIHAEAYAAGELKHGTIALITDHVPVIAIATQKHIFAKTISNIREVKARGAYVILLVTEDTAVDEGIADVIIRIPREDDKFTVFPIAVVLQLIAYYASVQKGLDVDQPRNLAKSVTVE